MKLTPELFQNILKDLKLSTADLYLFGDGSGSTISKSCGFACIAWYPSRKQYGVDIGGFNHGTNNVAELMPYLHSLWRDCSIKNTNMIYNKRSVQIISDSELIVKQGKRIYTRNAPLRGVWGAIDEFEKMGYAISWNHVSRNSNPINALCDKLAGEARKKFI
jgi:ribonuclease HI